MIDPNNVQEILSFLIKFHINSINNKANREEFINIINNSNMIDAKLCSWVCVSENHELLTNIHPFVNKTLRSTLAKNGITTEKYDDFCNTNTSINDSGKSMIRESKNYSLEQINKYPLLYGWVKYLEENKK